jgi:hypothetical protein
VEELVNLIQIEKNNIIAHPIINESPNFHYHPNYVHDHFNIDEFSHPNSSLEGID